MYLINCKYIKEVEARIGDNLIEEVIGEATDFSIEVVAKATEGMEEAEVTLREEHFKEEVISEIDIITIEWIGIGKIGEYGDNPGQEKEIEVDEVGHHLVLD